MQYKAVESQTVTAGSRAKRLRILLSLIVVLLPTLLTWLFLQAFFSATLLDFAPATDDEVLLWHQTATFQAAGFNGGYYTYEEQPAAVALSHFAAHGPFFPLLYGTVARLWGWHAYTGAVFNLVLVTAAILIFILAAQPGTRQLALLGVVLATFWAITYLIPDNSQEALHLSVGIVGAAVIYLLLKTDRPLSPLVLVPLFIFVIAISLLRPFWALLLPPLALIAARGRSFRIRVLSVGIALPVAGAVVALAIAFAAPYPNFVRDALEAFADSPRRALALELAKLRYDIPAFLGSGDRYPLAIVERYEMLALVGILGIGTVLAYYKTRPDRGTFLARHRVSLFIIYCLCSILIVNLFFYQPVGYQAYRVFAPSLLMAMLLLLMDEKYRLVILLIGINLLCLPIFLSTFQADKARNFRFDTVGVQAFSEATAAALQYDATANAWCNTILVDGALFCQDGRCDYALAIPPGFGISMVYFPQRLSAPLKSKYLLLTEQGMSVVRKRIGEELQLSTVARTPFGTLFQNQGAACR